MAEVILNNVTKRFGDQTKDMVVAVHNVNLTVSNGEFLVLLGPSGCGKTTTLRMVAGLETITEGEIFIGDRVVNDLAPGDRDIAFVFQFYALYPHLSVKDNISFPLRAQQVSKDEVERRVRDVAGRLRIEHILNRRPNRLPSGEQQRVALARAMVRQPQVFLMDEPLTNLDASLRADMRVELKHLQQELHTTMLYVTHDQVEAMSMSHRIAVMDKGILQQVGTPLEIYNRPKTLFVATFIGSPPMNIIPCRLEDDRLVGAGGFQYTLSSSALTQLERGQDYVLGVRAEDIQLNTGAAAHLQGVVRVREPLGDETIYVVESADQRLTVKTSPKQVFQPGERVQLSFSQERLHVFDRETEQRAL
jgi:ABC-type sugar transport system ATPase subunit